MHHPWDNILGFFLNFIGIDLGGTKIEGVCLDQNHTILARRRIPTPTDYPGIIHAICGMVESVCGSADYTLGVGTPGTMDADGYMINSNLEAIRGMPLLYDIQNITKHNIIMGNDADCFAAAEAALGAGANHNVVFGVIMGTGVGGGLVVDGHIIRGRVGAAGEWGHSTLYPNGSRCWCGRRGCVETYLSGPALEARWLQETGGMMSIPDIIAAKPPGFAAWRDAVVRDFGLALAGVVQVVDPDVIVLGGGLSNMSFLYDMGATSLYQNTLQGGTPILHNVLGDSAGVVGAALLGADAKP